jgi:hypothetical protein
MVEGLREKFGRVNTRVGRLLHEARLALRGEGPFGVQQVRELSSQLAEMAPLWAQAPDLRVLRPELEPDLNLYQSHLGDLNSTLQQVHLMLLAQRAQMEASRAQLAAISCWAQTMQRTR